MHYYMIILDMHPIFLTCTPQVVGAVALSAIGFNKVGGFQGLWEKYPLALGNISSNAALTSMNYSSATYQQGSLLYTNNSVYDEYDAKGRLLRRRQQLGPHLQTSGRFGVPVDRYSVFPADHRDLVLVYGPSNRAANSRSTKPYPRTRRNHICGIPKNPSTLHHDHAGNDRTSSLS